MKEGIEGTLSPMWHRLSTLKADVLFSAKIQVWNNKHKDNNTKCATHVHSSGNETPFFQP